MIGDRLYSKLSMAIGDSGLKAIGKLNVPLYRATKGRLFGKVRHSPVLLLTTTGRRSGVQRTAPVLYMREGRSYIVVGSNAGSARAPAWSLNLKANPSAKVQAGGRLEQVTARVAEGEERERLWRAMNEQYSGFDEYAQRTDRDIAVFVLEPR